MPKFMDLGRVLEGILAGDTLSGDSRGVFFLQKKIHVMNLCFSPPKKDSCHESLFLDALLLSTLPNVSLQQLSRPAMPFRLMAVLHCLRTGELLVKLLRIRGLGQPMA